jgi:hypothetical protein
MMGAWADAWGAMLTGRAMPALDLLNPATWTKDGSAAAEALESWLGTPQWSDVFSLDSATLKRLAPAVELAQVGQHYALAVTRLAMDVCRTFQERLAASNVTLDGSGAALDLWNDVVDEKLMAFNRSEAFADLQRRFLRSLMAHRLEQRRLAGHVAAHYDLPTREEIDELARRVHALERENRALRRMVQSGQKPDAPKTADTRGSGPASVGDELRTEETDA